jgi:uncharacterized protein YciI
MTLKDAIFINAHNAEDACTDRAEMPREVMNVYKNIQILEFEACA